MEHDASKHDLLRAFGERLAAEHGSAIEWTVDVVAPRGDIIVTVTFAGVRGMAQVSVVPVWPGPQTGLLYTGSPEPQLQLALYDEQSAFRDVVFGGLPHTSETSPEHDHIASFAGAWRDAARHALFRAAPWRFAETTARALAARKKAGRRPSSTVSLRLLGLPKQQRQRKASLVLARARRGELSIAVAWTASNARLAEVRCTRALDQDLRRLMLLDG